MPNAEELQKKLYGGGDIAYFETTGDFSIFFGVVTEFNKEYINGIIKLEGTAKPAKSLDELLAKLK